MPNLKSTDSHACFVCKTSLTMRKALKNHLTKTKADEKPRCPGLKKVIHSDVWVKQILPYKKIPTNFGDYLETLEGACTGVHKSRISKIAKSELKDTQTIT